MQIEILNPGEGDVTGPLFGLWTVHYLHALTYVTLFWLPREWRLFQQLESGLGYFTQVYSQIRDILSSQT